MSIQELLEKNKQLEKEINSVRESTIVESMNDMKTAYRKLIRENEELKRRNDEIAGGSMEAEVNSLREKTRLYLNIITEMERRSQKIVFANELVEKAIMNLADMDGEIVTNDIYLDGIFQVNHAANEIIHNYSKKLPKLLKCVDICTGCFRCSYLKSEDDF